MKKNILFKTNLMICIILIIGFLMTAVLGYRANYQEALLNIEQVSNLTSEGIYYQMTSLFTKPVNISMTMANDHLLKAYLEEESTEMNEEYIDHIASYLKAYQDKYQYDSVFLVSDKTQRYYNVNGLDRILEADNPENIWYESLKQQEAEYDLVVDNDEVKGADNALTVFVNFKIMADDGSFLGAVGVGLRVDELQQMLRVYERDYGIETYLVDSSGVIQISVSHTGYESLNIFDVKSYQPFRESVDELKDGSSTLQFWDDQIDDDGKSFIVARSLPELSWYLLVERNTGNLIHELTMRIYFTIFIVIGIIVLTLWIITKLIRKFNYQIIKLQTESEENFRKITEQMYDNIYELNVTKNSCVGESTQRYFNSLGASEDMTYGEALYVIAQKQIKEEYREGYINTFSPEHVQEMYDAGENHLKYDFMISQDGEAYYWMRIDARLFFNQEDECLHMVTYRKNIDDEKKQELSIRLQAQTDEMTGLYTKTATEQLINHMLQDHYGEQFAFVIFDIDNFKSANDCYGHMFGDQVIIEFAKRIKENLRSDDIVGRIGGDEFVAFLSIQEEASIKRKIKKLSDALNLDFSYGGNTWHISTSIGVSFAPKHAEEFAQLYEKADLALYKTKKRGKNGFTIYQDWEANQKE